LARHAERAKARGHSSDALSFYEIYLRFFPFGLRSWDDSLQAEWSRIAIAYVELLGKTEKPGTESLKQSLTALESYKRLGQAYENKDSKAYTELTDEILTTYPRSIFTQAAHHDDLLGPKRARPQWEIRGWTRASFAPT